MLPGMWRRAPLLAVLASLAGCSGALRSMYPSVSVDGAPATRFGAIEVDANADTVWIVDPSGSKQLAECDVPCVFVVAPGRYRVEAERGRTFLTRFGAEVDVEVSPCATERIELDLSWRLGATEGKGSIRRQKRIPMETDRTWPAKVRNACSDGEASASDRK